MCVDFLFNFLYIYGSVVSLRQWNICVFMEIVTAVFISTLGLQNMGFGGPLLTTKVHEWMKVQRKPEHQI